MRILATVTMQPTTPHLVYDNEHTLLYVFRPVAAGARVCVSRAPRVAAAGYCLLLEQQLPWTHLAVADRRLAAPLLAPAQLLLSLLLLSMCCCCCCNTTTVAFIYCCLLLRVATPT